MDNICNDVQLLNLLVIFKNIINLVKIVVPVILLIFVILDIIKNISSADVDNKKLFKSISKRVIVAVVIFLVPSILNTVLNAIPNNNMYYLDCYQNATKENLSTISIENAEKSFNLFSAEVSNYIRSSRKTDDEYNKAYALYEPARLDIKLIYDKETRESYEQKLLTEKRRLDSEAAKAQNK